RQSAPQRSLRPSSKSRARRTCSTVHYLTVSYYRASSSDTNSSDKGGRITKYPLFYAWRQKVGNKGKLEEPKNRRTKPPSASLEFWFFGSWNFIMDLACPACGRTLRLADEHSGKQIRCPACQQVSV